MGQTGRSRGERPTGTATSRAKRFKERTRGGGKRPHTCRQAQTAIHCRRHAAPPLPPNMDPPPSKGHSMGSHPAPSSRQ